VSTVGTELQAEAVVRDRELDARVERGYWAESARRLASDRVALACAAILLFLVVLALAAPLLSRWVTHARPDTQDLLLTFHGPTGKHWLGTDELGRDTLTRAIWGARVSLGVGALAVFVQIVIGTLVGLSAGYYGRWVDTVSMRIVDSVLSFPDIFLFMLVAVLIRPTPVALALLLASVGWADVSRLIRAEVIVLKSEDYILALRSLGARGRRIIFAHILRNALPIIIVTASLRIGQVILIEAALDFLGLGVQPPTPSWGNMLSNSQQYFYHSAWLVIVPGIAIFLAVLATNLLGNALRDALDPRLRHALVQL
jgi:peptide/nickel transport system permease protein